MEKSEKRKKIIRVDYCESQSNKFIKLFEIDDYGENKEFRIIGVIASLVTKFIYDEKYSEVAKMLEQQLDQNGYYSIVRRYNPDDSNEWITQL